MGGLALARDGTTLAFDNGEGALEVWDIGKEKPRKRLQWSARMKENNMGIYGLEMSPDGKVLVTNGFDNVVRFWDLTTEPPRERNHFAGHGHVRRVYIHSDGRSATLPIYDSNPDGADLALWKSGPIVRIWDVTARAPGQRQVPLENRDHVYELTFVPDGSEMAARAEKLDVLSDPLRLKRSDGPRSWSVRLEGSDSAMRGERESMRRGWHQQSPSAILWGAVSPDGQTLASAARDGKVILWEAATGGKYREWQLPGTVRRVEFAEDGRHLITANGNGTLYVLRLGQGVTALNDLAKLWETLASLHAGKAYPAIWSLIATPQRTVPFIKERLHPVEAPTTAEIQQLVDRLDDAQFKEREKATAALEELRQQAEPALRRKLAEQSSSPELRRRIEALLEKSKLISPSQLRMLRVIQILEQIGNADAQQLLKRLAQGAPQARETPQAQAALKRLAKRSDILR